MKKKGIDKKLDNRLPQEKCKLVRECQLRKIKYNHILSRLSKFIQKSINIYFWQESEEKSTFVIC